MRIRVFACLLLASNMFATTVYAGEAKIAIYVTPFYNSKGPDVNVGKYSEELKTNDSHKLEQTVKNMLDDKGLLTPEQMFVASIRLYELGEKDDAVYWFYEAQYRARLYASALRQIGTMGDKSFELRSAYGAFMQLAGPVLNGYAGCEPDKWLETLQKVKNDNRESPDLQKIFPGVTFVEKEKWGSLNKEISSGMSRLSNLIKNNKSTLKMKRAANNADEKYCK